jgi:hypothetical protein
VVRRVDELLGRLNERETKEEQVTDTATRPRLQLGRVLVTANAIAKLEQAQPDKAWQPEVAALVKRHEHGDWGDLCDEDKQANEEALGYGSRVLSKYRLAGFDMYVITDAETELCPACQVGIGECDRAKGSWSGGMHFRDDQPPRRLATTVMLVEDY